MIEEIILKQYNEYQNNIGDRTDARKAETI